MSPEELCRQPGCPRTRSQFSVFCDEHHRDELIRAGLLPAVPPDGAELVLKRLDSLVRARQSGVISQDEFIANLFDRFIHLGLHGFDEWWDLFLGPISRDTLASLLQYAKTHPQPRMFAPMPSSEEQRQLLQEVTLKLQSQFAERLEALLRSSRQ